jgi:hypothetical protein
MNDGTAPKIRTVDIISQNAHLLLVVASAIDALLLHGKLVI